MVERAVNVGIGIKAGDLSGVTAVDALSENLDQATAAIEKAKKQGGLSGVVAEVENKRLERLVGQLDQLHAQLSKVRAQMSTMDELSEDFERAAMQAEELQAEINGISAAIGRVPKRVPFEGGGSDVLGRGESAVMNIAGLAGGLGAGGAAQGLQLAGDIIGSTDALQKFSDVLLQNEGIIGKVASAGANLLAPLGATAAGLGSVLAVAAPVGLAVAGIAAILGQMQAQAEKTREATLTGLSAQERYFAIIATGSKESAESAIASSEEQIRAARGQRDEVASILQELQGIERRASESMGESALLSPAEQKARNDALAALSERLRELGFNVEETFNIFGDRASIIDTGVLQQKLDELDNSIVSSEGFIERLRQAIEEGLVTETGEASDALDALNQRLETLGQLAEQRQAAITQFNQQEADLLEDRERARLDTEEDAQIASERRLDAHNDNLARIETAGQAAIESIRMRGIERLKQFDTQTADLNERLSDLDAETAKNRDKINRDFMRREIETLEKFRADEARREGQYKKERLRALDDLHASLLTAEENNDVVAFIQAQRAGEKQLKEMQADHDDETRQRQEEFAAAREQARREREERLAEMETLAADRRADVEAQIQERAAMREAIVAEIQAQEQAERARIKAAQEAQIAAFKESERVLAEDAERRLKRQIRDQDIADERRLRAHNAQLAQIDEQMKKQITASDSVASQTANSFRNAATAIGNAVNGLITQIQQRAAAFNTSTFGGGGYAPGAGGSSLGAGSGSGGRDRVAFANEGVVTKPTFAMIGDRLKPDEAEAVVKFKPSEGIAARFMGNGGGGVTLHIGSVIVHGEVTHEEVIGIGLEIGGAILQGAANAVSSTGKPVQVSVG